jgi:hypothetical protein
MTEYPAGWTCQVVILRLERYRVATLALAESLAIAEHLEACTDCAERLLMVMVPGSRAHG